MRRINIINQLKEKLRTNPYTKKLYKKLGELKAPYKRSKRIKYVQENGLCLMQKVSQTLNPLGICWFFDFGTLLGIIREKQLIGHDMDIDVGVINDTGVKQKVEQALTNSGFKLCFEYIVDGRIVEQSYLCKKIVMDVHYYDNQGKHSSCYLLYQDPHKEYKADERDIVKLVLSKIDKTQKINFQGIDIKIPINAELLLEEKYGRSWRQPDKNWKYWEGPSAHKIEGVGKCIIY